MHTVYIYIHERYGRRGRCLKWKFWQIWLNSWGPAGFHEALWTDWCHCSRVCHQRAGGWSWDVFPESGLFAWSWFDWRCVIFICQVFFCNLIKPWAKKTHIFNLPKVDSRGKRHTVLSSRIAGLPVCATRANQQDQARPNGPRVCNGNVSSLRSCQSSAWRNCSDSVWEDQQLEVPVWMMLCGNAQHVVM